MMEALMKDAAAFLLTSPGNYICEEDAMREDLIGMRIYDAPLFAVGDATSAIFTSFKEPNVVHPDYMLPTDWLPGARSVISFFVPYTKRVKDANAASRKRPADEWLHARAEGHEMLVKLCGFVREWFMEKGHVAVVPMRDPRYHMLAEFASIWSERHTGYACGLGTFGLSKGLITAKGVAGRIGSVITTCVLPTTERPYKEIYDYCTMCGKCAHHCPVKCIDAARGPHFAKKHVPCSDFLDDIENLPRRGKSQKPRYGCGKCQVEVPCQDGIPENNKQVMR